MSVPVRVPCKEGLGTDERDELIEFELLSVLLKLADPPKGEMVAPEDGVAVAGAVSEEPTDKDPPNGDIEASPLLLAVSPLLPLPPPTPIEALRKAEVVPALDNVPQPLKEVLIDKEGEGVAEPLHNTVGDTEGGRLSE